MPTADTHTGPKRIVSPWSSRVEALACVPLGWFMFRYWSSHSTGPCVSKGEAGALAPLCDAPPQAHHLPRVQLVALVQDCINVVRAGGLNTGTTLELLPVLLTVLATKEDEPTAEKGHSVSSFPFPPSPPPPPPTCPAHSLVFAHSHVSCFQMSRVEMSRRRSWSPASVPPGGSWLWAQSGHQTWSLV